MISAKVKIQNNTDQEYKLFQLLQYNVEWSHPDSILPGETIETVLTFLGNVGDSCLGVLRYTTPLNDFQLQATAETEYQINPRTNQNVIATPNEVIPVVDQETLTVSFTEIAQKKGEPCSSKKDAKKAKESKSKGKRPT